MSVNSNNNHKNNTDNPYQITLNGNVIKLLRLKPQALFYLRKFAFKIPNSRINQNPITANQTITYSFTGLLKCFRIQCFSTITEQQYKLN